MNLSRIIIIVCFVGWSCSPPLAHTKLVNAGLGWSKTSINATIFRTNSVASHDGIQYMAYYDTVGRVILAKRTISSDTWKTQVTEFTGNVNDAHNGISIMVDRDGILHMAWDHHGNVLHYSKSKAPGSLDMSPELSMTGSFEENVTYPEFHRFPSGDLLFAYRDGSSGNGNLVLKKYSCASEEWNNLQTNLIDGEGKRNAYWQLCIDKEGTIHISWVWRESPDVASNHDMCYARSEDGGSTWSKSTGELYKLPVTLSSAEIIRKIPQGSNLINQTSMTTDKNGNPYIATYFKGASDSATQFKVIYRDESGSWQTSTATCRSDDFILGGMGTRSIPISRPQIIYQQTEHKIYLIYRDEELDNQICLTSNGIPFQKNWQTIQLTDYSMNRWEPSYDTELWKSRQELHLFHQKVGQASGEMATDVLPQMAGVLEVTW